jgi:colanic acid/amylovoran biosynthesis glycosyltransferase
MLKVAYIMSRFPKLTETFILYEMLAMQHRGTTVEVFPLLKERQDTSHPEARPFTERAHYQPFISFPILAAHWYFIRRKPIVYFRTLVEILRGTFGSANFFFGALGIFPKTVRFAMEMQKLNVQHVHAHFATHPALACLIIKRLTDIPYSFTVHGSDLHVERRMLRRKIEAASFAVAISAYNKSIMLRECGDGASNKIHVVHCGVDTEFWRPDSSRRRTSGGLQILCVASFEEVKGHTYLVAACKRLAEQGVDFTCHLVGEGPRRRHIEEQIAACQLTARFKLHGALPRPAVRELLAASDVFVLASVPTREGKREGIPVVLMEAMSCGLPVIASDLSGIPELVSNQVTGLLVPPGDDCLLAEALQTLEEQPELRIRMGRAGRERILSDFNLEKNALELLELFKSTRAAQLMPGARSNMNVPQEKPA